MIVLRPLRAVLTLENPPEALVAAVRAGLEDVPVTISGRIIAEETSWDRGEQSFLLHVDLALVSRDLAEGGEGSDGN